MIEVTAKIYNAKDKKFEDMGKVAMPFTIGNYLDERLDEAVITVYSKTKHYKTARLVNLIVVDTDPTKNVEYYFIIGADKSREVYPGANLFKHEISLIEPTKLLEGVQCQTLTFTNPTEKHKVEYVHADVTGVTEDAQKILEHYGIYMKDGAYVTPIKLGCDLVMVSFKELIKHFRGSEVRNFACDSSKSATVTYNLNGNDFSLLYNEGDDISFFEKTFRIKPESGTTNIQYLFHLYFYNNNGPLSIPIYVKFQVEVLEIFPLVPWNITTMTNRCLELAEPLFNHKENSERPRFIFDGMSYLNGVASAQAAPNTQAFRYKNVLVPELVLTQANLREQLKTIGSLIHCEPRVYVRNDDGPTFYVKYEPYSSTQLANIVNKPYAHKELNQDINEYCTEVKSNAKNITNSRGEISGRITEPMSGDGNFKTLRNDIVNVRLEPGNAKIVTSLPIYKIISLEAGYYKPQYDKNNNVTGYSLVSAEIKDYVFEKSDYDLLSSYSKSNLKSKSFALYYTQGQKNIDGLFFKRNSTSWESPFTEYAIYNILKNEDIEGEEEWFKGTEIANFTFKVTYIPIYSTMISHSKPLYDKNNFPYVKTYNQSENIIESAYIGENMKGVAARLGNVDEARTYFFSHIVELPKAGQRIEKNSISAIESLIYPTGIKSTIYLTKNFNRINQYIGIDSHKRQYEVSEKEAYQRDVLLKEYIVFSKNSINPDEYTMARNAKEFVVHMIISGVKERRIDSVTTWGLFKSGSRTDYITLPVITSSFGNNISFTWGFKDNYSAGTTLVEIEDENVEGLWTVEVPYGNYYGRIYTMAFWLFKGWKDKYNNNFGKYLEGANSYPIKPQNTSDEHPEGKENEDVNAEFSPIAATGSVNIDQYIIQKDSREVISTFSVLYEFISSEEDLIIGSGMASTCSLVRNDKYRQPHFYPLKCKVSGLISSMAEISSDDILSPTFTWRSVSYNGKQVIFETPRAEQVDLSAWVLAYPLVEENKTYVDEEGNTKKVKITTGGEILMICNNDVKAGEYLYNNEGGGKIYVSIKR